MTDQMKPKENAPAGGKMEDGKINFCKICGEELTETNHSKEKNEVCLDCEGKGAGELNDHTQQNVNKDGMSEEGTL